MLKLKKIDKKDINDLSKIIIIMIAIIIIIKEKKKNMKIQQWQKDFLGMIIIIIIIIIIILIIIIIIIIIRLIVDDSSENAIELNSHIIELPHKHRDSNREKGVYELFTMNNITRKSKNKSLLKDVENTEVEEFTASTLLCLPVEINGEPVGYALGDQGCTRTCMRASALKRIGLKVDEHKLINQFVICSSGEEIPIRSRFKAIYHQKEKQLVNR